MNLKERGIFNQNDIKELRALLLWPRYCWSSTSNFS